mmetsp:Transcript_15500/g.38989  ORF Transcript_15500/g.38989 Transcript_15500/m.38989 type:complete len:200 (+) Transcript_15500:1028-1627(+)
MGNPATYKLEPGCGSLPAKRTRMGGIGAARALPCRASTAALASETSANCTSAAQSVASLPRGSRTFKRTTWPYCEKTALSKNSGQPTGRPFTYKLSVGICSGLDTSALTSANLIVIWAFNCGGATPLRCAMTRAASSTVVICTKAAESWTACLTGGSKMRHRRMVPHVSKRAWRFSCVQFSGKPFTYKLSLGTAGSLPW